MNALLRRALLWVFVTSIGWIIALIIVAAIANILSSVLTRDSGEVIGSLVGGAVIGIVQWVMLRPLVRHFGRWILGSAVGWALGLSLAKFLRVDETGLFVSGAIIGIFAALALILLAPLEKWNLGDETIRLGPSR